MLDKLNSKIWEWFGKNDPYYGVITHDKYHKNNIDTFQQDSFFKSGEEYIKATFASIEKHLPGKFSPTKALDYGCGVGRLVIPLAKRCGYVVGVDISSSMLELAREHCKKQKVENAQFVLSSQHLASITEIDFVHSFIVFQHIPPKEGERILENLLGILAADGVGVIQLTFSRPEVTSTKRKLIFSAYRNIPFAYFIRNFLKKDHIIPMYEYDLNRVFSLLNRSGCNVFNVEFTDHGFLGMKIFFKKG